MIIGKIHPGSGLGDQLFSYIITRVIALDKGYKFGFVGKEFFKGKGFMNLDWGEEKPLELIYNVIPETGELITGHLSNTILHPYKIDKPYYDPNVNFIEDGTIIDGYGAQDPRYFKHRHHQIKEWLKTEPLYLSNGTCVINFRGGEFAAIPELFLPQEYWDKAIEMMKQKHSGLEFEVHTDDPILAKKFFPDFKIIQNVELNWKAVRNARHLILSNSAFGIIPALLNDNATEIIAPRYWNRRNLGRWDWPGNYYKKFTYI